MPQLDIVIFQIEYICFIVMFYVMFDLISFYILPFIFRNLYYKNVIVNSFISLNYKISTVFSKLSKIENLQINLKFIDTLTRRLVLSYIFLKTNKIYKYSWSFFDISGTWKNVYYYFLFTLIRPNHYILMYPYFKGINISSKKIKIRKFWSLLVTFYLSLLILGGDNNVNRI